MTHRIVTTIDPTSASHGGTARWCATWAPRFDADVMAVHVATGSEWPVTFVSTSPSSGDGDAWWLAELDERLRTWSLPIEQSGVRVETALLHGQPQQLLAQAAVAYNADLIVLGGSHTTHGGAERVADLAHHLLSEVAIPVAVVLGDGATCDGDRIAVAFDGGPESHTAMTIAAQWAAASDATLIACTAIPLAETPPEICEPYRMTQVENARTDLDAALAQYRQEGISCESLVVAGHESPGTQLSAVIEAYQPALIVCGTRAGNGAFAASVSHRLIARSTCPVLTVPKVIATRVATPRALDQRAIVGDAPISGALLRPVGGPSR